MKKMRHIFATLLLAAGLSAVAYAQVAGTFSLEHTNIVPGGDVAQNGSLTLISSLGNPVGGTTSEAGGLRLDITLLVQREILEVPVELDHFTVE